MAKTLLSIFPNADELLALGPEDLAGVLIELLPELSDRRGKKFRLNCFLDPLCAPASPYPQGSRRSVIRAVAEAIAWLEVQGLVIEDPEEPSQHYIPTRRAEALRTRADVESFRKGRLLPAELLQATLTEKVHPLFLRGDHDVAVFQAFKIVEVAVRRGAGYPDDLVGTALMRKAFHPESGPLTDKSLVAAEREAEMHLFSGAIGHAKNPGSHRDVVLSPQEAARLIVFASHLLGIVEQRLG